MILSNATLATMTDGTDYGLIENGALVVDGTKIAWVGASDDIPVQYQDDSTVNLDGRTVTPGLIDCHTHVVFGGNRAKEFEMRLNGASYEDVARAGGGIVSTVKATRGATLDALVDMALPRVDALLAEGVTTLEIKSGYGLDCETELNMLRAARQIARQRDVTVTTTFLGAHAVPSDFDGTADAYIDDVCIPALRSAHAEGLVDTVDGFCENIAFTPDQISRVFDVAVELGLPVKLHAEQLSNLGGTQLAARYKALSADHLEYATVDDAAVMAKAGTVAVILPGAYYTLSETQAPPIQAFRDAGVPMALATDCNPGSSPLASILIAMNMGCTLFKMTPAETLAGVTRYAAKALAMENTGVLAPGRRADLTIWNVKHPGELSYRIGFNPLYRRMFNGTFDQSANGDMA